MRHLQETTAVSLEAGAHCLREDMYVMLRLETQPEQQCGAQHGQ